MATWTTVPLLDIQERLGSTHFAAVQANALADGQPDPWSGLISKVVAQFRGAIEQSPRNVLGAGVTVPTSAVRHVVSVAVCDGLGRFGLGKLIDDNRAKDKEEALAWLRRVEEGKLTFAAPETPAEDQREQPLLETVVDPPARQNTRDKLGRLF